MKRVLVIYYTQTGQLLDIAKRLGNSIGEEVHVSYYEVKPKPAFEFPWKKKTFYETFPETYLQRPCGLVDMDDPLLKQNYDLIILSYQVWFLTPSMPINSFMRHEGSSALFRDTPVVTLIGCRNMWIQAQEKMKLLLQEKQANLVGHIALVDRHINHISVLTIAHWMFSGKKDRMFGIFPKPGVSDEDIQGVERFGAPIRKALIANDFTGLQDELVSLDAVKIKSFLVLTDQRGGFLFSKWAQLIDSKGDKGSKARAPYLKAFEVYLFFAIWIIAPLVFVVYLVTYFFKRKSFQEEKRYFSSVEIKAQA